MFYSSVVPPNSGANGRTTKQISPIFSKHKNMLFEGNKEKVEGQNICNRNSGAHHFLKGSENTVPHKHGEQHIQQCRSPGNCKPTSYQGNPSLFKSMVFCTMAKICSKTMLCIKLNTTIIAAVYSGGAPECHL